MTEQLPIRPSFFRRAVTFLAGLYLLSMLLYLLGRFTIQDSFWLFSLVNSFAHLLFLPLPLLLILALLARSRRAFFSLLPIIILGLVWFGPRFLPKNIAPAQTLVLRVMTSNVWRLNPTPEAVAQLALDNQADVIFLQEVEPTTQQPTLTMLNAVYPYQNRLVDEIRASMYTSVNMTYSRYPFVSSEQIALNAPKMPYIYRSVIQVNGQPIALYNTHLTAPVTGSRRVQVSDDYFSRVALGFDDSERNQQLAALLAHLQTEPYPYIIAGDFNTSDLSMTYTWVASEMGDSFAEAGVGFGSSWPMVEALGWPSLPPFIRMDYIWHGQGLRTIKSWQGTFVGSDHLPLLAEFEVEQPA